MATIGGLVAGLMMAAIPAAIVGAIALLIAAVRRDARIRVWRSAAERVGLGTIEQSEGGFFGGEYVAGLVAEPTGALRVRLESYRRGKYERGTKIVITGLRHGAGGLSVRREGLGTAFEKRFVGEREIEIGDPLFDEECFVQGPAPLALALLDPETRRRLAALMQRRVALPGGGSAEVSPSLSDGVLEVRVRESGFFGNRERIPDILAGVLDVARQLIAPPDLAARIAENLRAEPEAGVRLQGLLMLSREFPHHPATREALLTAQGDRSPQVRLRAAMALGEEGSETLLALVTGSGVDDSCVARAIAALGDRLPAEQAEATLRRALAGAGRPQAAQACLEALVRLGRSEAEELILEALRHEDAQVAVAAARALGRVGTVAAVAELRETMRSRGDLLQSAGRQAIAEIQARLTGAEPGQLSLAVGEAGALSLADGEPGRLSLAEPAEERLPPEAEPEPGEGRPARREPRELA